MKSIISSIAHDALALSRLQLHYEQPGAIDALKKLVHEIKRVKTSSNRVLTTGIGKSGFVARRCAASLASVGVASHFVHGTEWVHGDFGVALPGDLVIGFSHSGNTQELHSIQEELNLRNVKLAAIVGYQDSALGRAADHVILAPATDEILTKVPSRSIVVQESVVNAIVASYVQLTEFSVEDFVVNHPGGSIGKHGRR
jgi:arabinose-5-phosphate isomerase